MDAAALPPLHKRRAVCADGQRAMTVCEGPRLPCRALAAVTAPRYVRASRTTGIAAN